MNERADWLVQTRLQPPLLHADTIERQRLLEVLRTAVSSRPVTLLSAPAGYGKTTLLASLPRVLPEYRLAWLTLDEEDNDPAGFLGALSAALDKLAPGLRQGALQVPGTDPRRAMALLINEVLVRLPDPFVLVLDDLHLITEPSTLAALDFLIERLPAQMRLVIATRHDPPLALARLIARRQVAEIRRPHLSFTPDEASQLLNETLGLGLRPADLGALFARTEGWAAGLCLLASSLERVTTDSGRTALLTGLAQTDQYLFDFLAAEVLGHQAPETRAFLLQTSILSDLTPDLVEAVTGRSDSGRLLQELYRKNLFLAVSESGAYRYHALFAEFLRQQLAQEDPNLFRELHRRAALAQPSRVRATGHYLAAGLCDEAANVMESIGEELLLTGLAGTLRKWCQQMPDTVLERHPRLCFLLSRALIGLADYPGAYRLAGQALEGCLRSGDQPGVAIALNAACSVAMVMGDKERCRGPAARFAALGALPPALAARRASAVAYLHGCDRQWTEAGAAAREAMALAEASGDLSAASDVAYRFGPWVLNLPGGLEAAERFLGWAQGRAPAESSTLRLVLADRRAWADLQRGRLDTAAAAAAEALAIKERIGGYPWLGAASTAVLATLAALQGRQAEAGAHVERLVQSLERLAPDQAEIWLYVAGRTFWLLEQMEPVKRLLIRMQDPAAARGFAVGPALQLRLAGLLALRDRRLIEAESTFRAALEAEEASPVTRVPGSGRVLLIRALLELNRPAEALDELRTLVAECEALRMPGLLLQEGRLILPLLEQVAGVLPGDGLAVQAVALLGGTTPEAAAPARVVARLPEALTEREVAVLRYLAAGATNRAIAGALLIGEETVKTHVGRILRKLEVGSRAEAVVRGRELGLV